MVTPETPDDDTSPFEPDPPNSKDKDSSAEASADSQYHGVYGDNGTPDDSGGSSTPGPMVPDPTLTMDYTTAPDFLPVDQSGSGTAPTTTVTPAFRFSIDLGGLRTLENTVLAATGEMVDQYTSLVSAVSSANGSSTLWGQNVYTSTFDTSSLTSPQGDAPDILSDTQFDQEGADFAAAMAPAMTAVLSEVAQTIEVIGQFTALLNNAGQTYAQTDYSSAFEVPSPSA